MVPDVKSLKYLQETLNVSRETLMRLQMFVDLTLEWQKAINLVSPATLPQIWERHIVDSAQLYPLLPIRTRSVLDIGSGGGFPAIVLAIIAADTLKFTLVESDRRKGIFLREAARVVGLKNINVVTTRIERLPPQNFDLVTARALATTTQILAWAKPYSHRFLFPKGENVDSEIMDLPKTYKIKSFQSLTDSHAKILLIETL